MPVTYNKPNKYDYVTRKAFDRYCDLVDRRRKLEIEGHRADMQALIQRLNNLESELKEATDELHMMSHDLATVEESLERDPPKKGYGEPK